MCEFISWIEYEDEILFICDEVVKDKYVRNKLKDCKDNDLIGHGALRKIYNLKPSEGENCEVIDFWNLEKLPRVIRDKIKDFDSNFKYVWEHFMQNDDLRRIIYSAPDEYKGKAWIQFLKNKPNNDDLMQIIDYAPDEYKGKASELLLKNKPNNDDLMLIVCYAPAEYKGKAWIQFLKNKPNNDDLRRIIYFAPAEYKRKASELLLKNKRM